jgi:hypothetical protein
MIKFVLLTLLQLASLALFVIAFAIGAGLYTGILQ